jgi:energy-coupling factor transporter ATP-binding protein EcfA2
MKLLSATVSGYKRLAEDCEIKLDTDPVCIVGPNAAGKSSLLKALEHLNHENGFELVEQTRVPDGEPLDARVEARFALDSQDREHLADIPEAKDVKQLLVFKEDSDIYLEPVPAPGRDFDPRKRALVILEELARSPWLAKVAPIELANEPEIERPVPVVVEGAVEIAASEKQNLEDLSAWELLRERLGWIIREQQNEATARKENDADGESESAVWHDWPELPQKYSKLDNELQALIAHERREHPEDLVKNALRYRVPQFILFDDLARELGPVYDVVNEERPEDGAAIHNLLRLLDTSWEEAGQILGRNDPGKIKVYDQKLNRLLSERAAMVWEASDLEVQMLLNGTTLTILLSMQADDYIAFDQHSEGLRQFVALRAFLARQSRNTPPVILIDEAETHLHYDAQADLVAVFESQTDAAKIIYTTHSAGCLPRDLGLGVRAIVPELVAEDDGEEAPGDHSRVINKFWTEGRGFSPLLLAMGAGALAFSATQKAVITEGMSDVLLLPTLIREATGEERLSYQPAPSFAEATSPEEIADLDLIASRVAVLADGDEGGKAHVKRLTDNCILDEQVAYLGGAPDSGLSIEDLLVDHIYLNAVNEQLDRWHNLQFPADQLPETGRSHFIDKWCEQKTAELGKKVKLSKVDVAQGVLDQRRDENGEAVQLLDPAYKQLLVDLNEQLITIFKEAPSRVKKLQEALRAATDPQSGDPYPAGSN